ncbi:MAG: 2-oxoacid:acceptor oxidoreductase family protein [Candidatus Micrarchaeia archaeon]
MLLQVVFHGRAGQGIVTAAELLAVAAGSEGKHSQAFPVFGSEKRGPPVQSFCRISDAPITVHEQIYEPDVTVVCDKTVMPSVNVCSGMDSKKAIAIVNSSTPVKLPCKTVVCVDATQIAVKNFGKPVVNTVMLGAFAAATNAVKVESLEKAARERFPGSLGEANAKAIKECFEQVKAVK